MSKIIINGVDGNLGKQVVTDIINLIPKKNVILTAPSDEPCLLYTSPSPRDTTSSRLPSSA